MITCFNPIVDKDCKLIILGSMPGKESLRKQQYYGFIRNQFWKILSEIFDEELNNNYEDKTKFLLNHNIALWDVLKSCEREGSLDSNIKDEEANDFKSFFMKYPRIEYVLFNGTKAMQSFKKNIGFDTYPHLKEYILLPSTSPAHTMKFDRKLDEWKIVKKLLKSNEDTK